MGFNSGFKGLIIKIDLSFHIKHEYKTINLKPPQNRIRHLENGYRQPPDDCIQKQIDLFKGLSGYDGK